MKKNFNQTFEVALGRIGRAKKNILHPDDMDALALLVEIELILDCLNIVESDNFHTATGQIHLNNVLGRTRDLTKALSLLPTAFKSLDRFSKGRQHGY